MMRSSGSSVLIPCGVCREIRSMVIFRPAMTGKIKGVKGKLDINVRLTAAKELLPYGYSKIATIKHELENGGEPILLSWEGQQDLFEEPLTLSEKIDSLP